MGIYSYLFGIHRNRKDKVPPKTTSKPVITRCKQIITAVPGQLPIDNGCIVLKGDTILDIGQYSELKKHYSGTAVDLGHITLTPGLINAHCHLKLSKLKGKTLAGQGFVPWLLSMLAQDYQDTDFTAVTDAVIQAKNQGTCCFGDIITSDDARISTILTELDMFHTCFCEAFGFSSITPKITPIPYGKSTLGAITGGGHALHTTGANVLQTVKKQCSARDLPFSIHMAEHEDETGMLMGEENRFYTLLKENGILQDNFIPPMKTPVEYGRDLGLLDNTTLAVHCVQVSDSDLQILNKTGTSICLCPRSNEFIGVGRAPLEKILATEINVCLGTDSLASNHDLNLWNELSFFIREIDMKCSIAEAVQLLSHNPAHALLMADRLGTLERGKVWRYAIMPDEVVDLFQ